jgi:ATP-dependent DNA helicase DinG
MGAMPAWVDDIFGEGGRLARMGAELTPPLAYEFRPQQLEMAECVADTLAAGGRAIIEAGTGIGKTLAYLVPAVLSGKKTLISTATKNLQEQIFYKDVPFLKKLGFEFTVSYLKGRSNYLCKFRFEDFKLAPLFRNKADGVHFSKIVAWERTTETGDRAELSDIPDNYATWMDISTTTDGCLGRDCRFYDDCFVTRVRRKAAESQIVIVNHHLFFADLAVRAGGHGEVLPDVEAVIFDEAHHLEETASSFFGRSVSVFRFRDLTADYQRAIRDLKSPPMDLVRALHQCDEAAKALFNIAATRIPKKERSELTAEFLQSPDVLGALDDTVSALDALRRVTVGTTRLGETGTALVRRCSEVRDDLTFVLRQKDGSWVYLSEFRGRRRSHLFLQAFPVDLTPFFVQLLYPMHRITLFTSATLTVDGRFDYFRTRIALGEREPVAELMLSSSFDYMDQSLLYVPESLPEPNAADFVDRIAPEIEALLEITEGRAFVLFTSYRNMQRTHELLKDRLPYNVLVQGERSRAALLGEFRERPSVLFATASFWEGVDVPGDHLSLVIVDKLPFASPFDPLVKARINYVKEQGGDAFNQYQLPKAAITLKQGFGRLIRHRSDRGIVAILDRRLLERRYGRVFINTLPRARRTRDLDVVRRWFLH